MTLSEIEKKLDEVSLGLMDVQKKHRETQKRLSAYVTELQTLKKRIRDGNITANAE